MSCRNERAHIEACVRSVLAQHSPAGGFELIIADGMSDDGTRNILKRLAKEDPRLRVVDNPGRIVSCGLNAAIRAARGKIIARMDAHTEYAPDYVSQCLAALTETGANNVGGPARTRAHNYTQSVISAAYHSPFAVGGARFHNVNYEGYVDTVTYGCWRREVFDWIGLFDEELVRNQDDELNLRLIKAGGKIWQSSQIRSWYTPRASLRSLFRQYAQYGYWKVRVIQKHRIPASWRHLVPAGFLLSLILLAATALWWPIALWSLMVLVSLYVSSNVIASFLTAARNSWRALPLLPIVFACYHFSYGYGFLRGILDFVVFRRGHYHAYSPLNRVSVQTHR
ncbi:MAG TPA: glycosyltransferase family 2 protein [Candidatus Binatia bacterium]|jgi:glycosyltransferase involved in cell wall biosynthesis|nr:glycosyltransferase family 2 protein [Candidatus Binatia bacterium]